METVQLPGGIVYDAYAAGGSAGGAALFVHGFGSRRDGEKARHLGSVLPGAGISFVAPDLRGHGESAGRLEELTIEGAIGDVVRVAVRAGFFRASRRALIGSSFGALVAAWASVDHPRLCHRLVLLAPAFGFVERHRATMRVKSEWVDARLSEDLVEESARRRDEDLARRLAVPTLILHGERDEAVPVDASRAFVRARPDVRLLVVPGGDHRLTAWKELIAREVLGFLAA